MAVDEKTKLTQLDAKVDAAMGRLLAGPHDLSGEEQKVCRAIFRAKYVGIPLSAVAERLYERALKRYA